MEVNFQALLGTLKVLESARKAKKGLEKAFFWHKIRCRPINSGVSSF